MEENSNQNAFILQTIDLTSTNSDYLSKECVLNEAPILISTSELNNGSQFITCYENGEIVLKEIEDSIVNASKIKDKIVAITNKEDKPVTISTSSTGAKMKTKKLHKAQEKQTIKIRKKLCYEKPFNIQPSALQPKQDIQAILKYPRKQVIDHRIMISPREFKRQLNYTEDTITTTKLAPCTRQQLVQVLNGITTLFAHPAHKMPNANLMQMYVSRCTCKKEPNMMSTEDMDLLPLIENIAKPPIKTNPPVKRMYSKRKNKSEISVETQKLQIIENVKGTGSNINLSSIKKIYRNRKYSNYNTENIDHIYSKIITNEPELEKINIGETKSGDDSIYTITLDLDNIKEEHITENQIVILSVDNDGELTENNINMLLDASNNIKTEVSTESEKEVVALTRNVGSEDFNNRISNIFVVRKSNDNNETEHILGDISDFNTS